MSSIFRSACELLVGLRCSCRVTPSISHFRGLTFVLFFKEALIFLHSPIKYFSAACMALLLCRPIHSTKNNCGLPFCDSANASLYRLILPALNASRPNPRAVIPTYQGVSFLPYATAKIKQPFKDEFFSLRFQNSSPLCSLIIFPPARMRVVSTATGPCTLKLTILIPNLSFFSLHRNRLAQIVR